MNKRKMIFVLVLVCFIVFFNSLWGEYVSDDVGALLNNPLQNNWWMVKLFGLRIINYPIVFHLQNVSLHAICTVLVFLILNFWFTATASFFGALLFAVHPIHTEGVSWICGRGHVQHAVALFWLLYCYHKVSSAVKINWKWYGLAFLGYLYFVRYGYGWLIGMPVVLVLIDIINKRFRPLLYIPFLLSLGLRLYFATPEIIKRILSITNQTGIENFTNNPLALIPYSITTNLGLIFAPIRLTFYHEPLFTTMPLLILRGVGVIVLLGLLPFIYKKSKPVFFGICFFILYLAPTYSLKAVAWLIADRYLYPVSILASIVLAEIYDRFEKKWGFNLILGVLMLILVFSIRTVIRNEEWRTPMKLWTSTTIESPLSPRAWNNLGEVYLKDGNSKKAIEIFKYTIEIFPRYAIAWHNLGVAYFSIEKYTEAVEAYETAIKFNPKQFESLFNVGVIYLNSDMFDKAIDRFIQALKVQPVDETLRIKNKFKEETEKVLELAKKLKMEEVKNVTGEPVRNIEKKAAK